ELSPAGGTVPRRHPVATLGQPFGDRSAHRAGAHHRDGTHGARRPGHRAVTAGAAVRSVSVVIRLSVKNRSRPARVVKSYDPANRAAIARPTSATSTASASPATSSGTVPSISKIRTRVAPLRNTDVDSSVVPPIRSGGSAAAASTVA